jgi:prevent-host-death family protein
MQINIYEAKAKLSSLLDRVASGEEVVIARAGKPVARLVPLEGGGSTNGVRLGGLKAELADLPAQFHAPMTDTDLLGA